MQKTANFRRNNKRIFLIMVFFTFIGGLHAQTAFPGKDYWSMDTGFGMTGFLVEGRSYQAVIDPKIWLSQPLMLGNKVSVNYSTDEILSFESQLYLRWNFLHLGETEKKAEVFVQGGLGALAAYRGSRENPFDNVTNNRGSVMFDAAVGVTIPITSRWHIEPLIRGGYPHIAGFSITAGYKFPFKERHITTKEEIIRQITVASVDFVMFGPDSAQYNYSVDRDAQGLNEMVINHVAQMLTEHPDYRVRIEGHANPVTNDPSEYEKLMTLSGLRANTIANRLAVKGVTREQMVIVAHGGTRLITTDYDIRNRNRRVELIVINVNDNQNN
jgi:outer membrane protein OmpA-like peptidoglycan-associated protein